MTSTTQNKRPQGRVTSCRIPVDLEGFVEEFRADAGNMAALITIGLRRELTERGYLKEKSDGP